MGLEVKRDEDECQRKKEVRDGVAAGGRGERERERERKDKREKDQHTH